MLTVTINKSNIWNYNSKSAKKIKEKDILIKEYEKVINNILEKLNIKDDESTTETLTTRTDDIK